MNDLQLTYLYKAELSGAPITSPIVDIIGNPYNTCCGPYLNVSVNNVPAGGTAVTIALQGSDDVAFSSPVTLFTTSALDTTTGTPKFVYQLSNPFPKYRFTRVVITATGTYTTGQISVYISDSRSFNWQQLEEAIG